MKSKNGRARHVRPIKLWTLQKDLAALFAARRVCYFLGSYDGSSNYGDIAQFAATLARLRPLLSETLPVGLIDLRQIANFKDLSNEQTELLTDCCFLFYRRGSDRLEREQTQIVREIELAEVLHAPPTYSQIVMYGGGFFNDDWGWGTTKLDLIEAFEEWLRESETNGADPVPLTIVGQQVDERFLTGVQSHRLTGLLARARAVGVRDAVSYDILARHLDDQLGPRLFISGDDAAPLILSRRLRHSSSGERPITPSVADPSRKPFTVNVHLSPEDYVTDDPAGLLALAAGAIRHLAQLTGASLRVHLIAAYEDRRISESRYLDQLRATLAQEGIEAQLIQCIDELRDGFPRFGAADLTITCSYHVGLTSLLCTIPTVLLFGNTYYQHKHEGLRRAFGLPDNLIVDLRNGASEQLRAAVQSIVAHRNFRDDVVASAGRGTAQMATRSATTTTLLAEFLMSGYLAHAESRFRETSDRLCEALEQLSDLQFDYARLLNLATAASQAGTAVHALWSGGEEDYRQLVRRIQQIVREVVPPQATVAVVSRGDNELLQFENRRAWHFPRTLDGTYAGYHPANSAAAIGHLEELRAQGADFLLLPVTAMWWLDHYSEFKQHLQNQYDLVIDQTDTCLVYALGAIATMRSLQAKAADLETRLEQVYREIRSRELLPRIQQTVRRTIPQDARVLVVNSGDIRLLELDGCQTWQFPSEQEGHAGYYPPDSAAAIARLETLRAQGANFLLLPNKAFWWFDHYKELKQHLDEKYLRIQSDDYCVIYQLNNSDALVAYDAEATHMAEEESAHA